MRGTSSGPCSYSPATSDVDAPMPNGGTVTPTCPLPKNGDGVRAGSDVASTNAESAAGVCAAARAAAAGAALASAAPAATARAVRPGDGPVPARRLTNHPAMPYCFDVDCDGDVVDPVDAGDVGSPFAPKSYRNDTVSRRGRIGRARKIGFVPDVKRRGLPSSSPSPWKAFNSRTSSVTPFCGKRYDAPKLK